MENLNTDAAIRDLTERLLQKQLPKAEWTHEAHIAAAICLHTEFPEFNLKQDLEAVILAHNENVGTPNSETEGYHHTITLFYARLVEDVCSAVSVKHRLSDILKLIMVSPMGGKKYTLQFYSKELLFSVLARKQWVEPDLKSLELIKKDVERSVSKTSENRSKII